MVLTLSTVIFVHILPNVFSPITFVQPPITVTWIRLRWFGITCELECIVIIIEVKTAILIPTRTSAPAPFYMINVAHDFWVQPILRSWSWLRNWRIEDAILQSIHVTNCLIRGKMMHWFPDMFSLFIFIPTLSFPVKCILVELVTPIIIVAFDYFWCFCRVEATFILTLPYIIPVVYSFTFCPTFIF